jgi:hypothetical protein
MKKIVTWSAALLLVAACSTAFAGKGNTDKAVGNAGNPGVAPPQSHAFGKTYGEWGAAWWQWALALPNPVNPWFDETGDMIANGQSGHVWFLTGVINVSGTAVRQSTVPAGKALFFPVLNAECSNLEGAPWYGGNEAELRECVVVGNPLGLWRFAEIDGVPVKNIDQYYALTPMFTFSVPADNGLGVQGPATGISMSHGIWLMLEPLSVGTHIIHFGGGDPTAFNLDITYILTVK